MSEDIELEMIRRKKMAEMAKAETISIPHTVVEIKDVDHFNQLVNDYKEHLIIVDNWAPWCGPCRSFAPIYDALQKEFEPKGVIFTKLNVDNHQDIAQQFQVSGIPTTLFIHNKKLVHRQVGMVPKPQFKQIVDSVLHKMKK